MKELFNEMPSFHTKICFIDVHLLRDAISGPSHRYKSRVQGLAFVITKCKSKVPMRIAHEDMSKILNHSHIRISENKMTKTVQTVNLLLKF